MTSRKDIWIAWEDLFLYEMKQIKKKFPFFLYNEYREMIWIKTEKGWDGKLGKINE